MQHKALTSQFEFAQEVSTVQKVNGPEKYTVPRHTMFTSFTFIGYLKL